MAEYRFVEELPDLIEPGEYAAHPEGGLVRFRIEVTAEGVRIIGDALRPELLEKILETLDPDVVEQMLCG